MSCLEESRNTPKTVDKKKRNTPKTEENEEKSAVDNMGLSSLGLRSIRLRFSSGSHQLSYWAQCLYAECG